MEHTMSITLRCIWNFSQEERSDWIMSVSSKQRPLVLILLALIRINEEVSVIFSRNLSLFSPRFPVEWNLFSLYIFQPMYLSIASFIWMLSCIETTNNYSIIFPPNDMMTNTPSKKKVLQSLGKIQVSGSFYNILC